jgi:uncharacterized protein (TIGR02217 family)
MIVIDAPLPDCIAFGMRSDPAWSTDIVAAISGREVANQKWAHTRHYYDLAFAVRIASDYMAIRTHFHSVRGRTYAFLVKDPLDYAAVQSDGITDEAEVASDGWQMFKVYGTGPYAYSRRITRPVSGSLTIWRTRSAVTTDVTGSATVDYSAGTFTVSGDTPGDTYAWAGEFRVPCRYDIDRLPGAIMNRQPNDGELIVSCDSIPLVEVRE